MGDFLIILCLNCIKISQKQAWRPLIYFAWMKSMYFREYVCRFSRKLHYFCILGVSHLNTLRPRQDGWHFADGITTASWWCHDMKTFSTLLALCVDQWCGTWMCSLLITFMSFWTNSWVASGSRWHDTCFCTNIHKHSTHQPGNMERVSKGFQHHDSCVIMDIIHILTSELAPKSKLTSQTHLEVALAKWKWLS